MGEIKKITNQSDFNISYIKVEHKTDNGTVLSGEVKDNINMWFPWVDNNKEFIEKTIIIEVLDVARIFMWESGDYVYYAISKENLDGPYNPRSEISFTGNEYFSGKLAPGDNKKGWKELEVRNDGDDISIKLYNY